MVELQPCKSVRGTVEPPGDKSISHRCAILGAIAQGDTRLHNFALGQDCRSTLSCLRQLGVSIDAEGMDVTVHGVGLYGLQAPRQALDAGNSGTTLRLLSGVLAAQSFRSELTGDASLQRRPMRRIIEPLRRMGAILEARDGRYPPLKITGGRLKAIEFYPETPSAQVKSCVLLAGLYAPGTTVVHEKIATRDHTELALRHMGADLRVSSAGIEMRPGGALKSVELTVPGDLSSAMFWLLAAMILPGSEIRITRVGLNPTRNSVLGLLLTWGADLEMTLPPKVTGEVSGEITIRHSPNLGKVGKLEITPERTPSLIDEIPALAVLGSQTPHGLRIRGAGELRVKESDRLHALTENLQRMGVSVKEFSDGFDVAGGQRLRGAQIESYGDHRIAMAFAVAALAASGPSRILNSECVAVSYPGFFDTLRSLSIH